MCIHYMHAHTMSKLGFSLHSLFFVASGPKHVNFPDFKKSIDFICGADLNADSSVLVGVRAGKVKLLSFSVCNDRALNFQRA